ncbi:hypothetical protein AMECASPLE_017059 [Ameca splendens]|uniref:Uncharacterized protein n=1 Tax=Ameca splendens TaxID=208324 RepID=A0ABV1A8R9_9TELE
MWLHLGGGGCLGEAGYVVWECVWLACWGASGVEVWGWRGARSLACCGDLTLMPPSGALAPGLVPGCGRHVGGAMENVLFLHWGGWRVVLGLVRLVCPVRLPGWHVFFSHGWA